VRREGGEGEGAGKVEWDGEEGGRGKAAYSRMWQKVA